MIAELMARVRSLWRGVVRTRQVDADLYEEFRLHIELRAADLVRAGMTPAEAARKARAEFGSTEYHVEKARNARGLGWFDEMRFSWLDLKLGLRMLVKYPGLTLVGGLSMAFAIWVGAGTFEAIRQLVFPTIPLPDADRIVMLQNWDASANRPELRATHDFVAWRGSLQSVQDLGAYRAVTQNLMITEGLAEPVFTAEVSAAAFRVLRVPPVLGRTLVESDEQAGAPLVAVIGYDLWQSRFNGDSGVVGRTVRLTGAPATIVGVMPDGFAFPRTQELWVPLRIDVSGYDRRQGMTIRIFGRLAPGASLEQARTELTNLGRIAAGDFPRDSPAPPPAAVHVCRIGAGDWRTGRVDDAVDGEHLRHDAPRARVRQRRTADVRARGHARERDRRAVRARRQQTAHRHADLRRSAGARRRRSGCGADRGWMGGAVGAGSHARRAHRRERQLSVLGRRHSSRR